ncbi:MAG TPA: NADH-ubiquinone oxidoreductase-F iron-sulfur binding region domain-containing protein, partial [Longimicrobiales bacterium]|nr:NADH-ubiquinone oxidoreductase-F iron-sulfur binding region domain-containing protein [Longimicrobiales bacterium]
TKLYCVSGHVNRPGNYELPLGFPLMELINDVCGGMRDGKALKAVIPGGSSVPLLNAEECAGCNLDYEGVQAAGSQLGCASVIVMDENTDIVKQVRRMVAFYAHESCGQCTPCREGTAWMTKILKRIEEGRGKEDDLQTLLDMSRQMTGTTICVLSDSAAAPVVSSIQKFKDEYLALIRRGERVGVA